MMAPIPADVVQRGPAGMSGEQMKIDVEQNEASVVLTPHGEIDLSSSPELRESLLSALRGKPSKLIVNLGKTPYMDSSGVATLVEAMQKAMRSQTKLVLCGMEDKVRSIFEIARLDAVFTIVDDTDAAQTV